MSKTLITTILLCAAVAAFATAAEIPERPEELEFPELSFNVPDAAAMRFELSNGTPVYLQEDHQLPLVNIAVYFKGGGYMVPAEKAGLTNIVSDAWRSGGAGEMSAQELDEALDFLAAFVRASVGDAQGSASLNVLSKDLDEAMGLFMSVLTEPRFQEDRFAKAKEDLLQGMKRRNDDTAAIERREWNRLIFGEDFWMNNLPTKATLDAITVDDCKALVSGLVRSDNIVIAVSGDIDRQKAVKLLEPTLGALPKLEQPIPAIPQPDHTPEPGVYVVDKPDVNQGRVRVGHIGYMLGDPDEFALRVGNDILGGGGFTARMMKKIRSDEGLAYGAYSSLRFPLTMPGVFSAYFQTKSSTCAYASELAFELISGMRGDSVTAEELTTSKASFIETFPRRFESASATVAQFALGELLGRPADYWTTYRDKVAAVDGAAIQKAMERKIHPDKMIVLVVGNIEEIMKGHPDHAAKMTDFGDIHRLPLRDPMTLQPLGS
jgi:predicted Zn-dependent peptidase